MDDRVSTGTLVWRISLRLLLVAVVAVFCVTLLRPLLHLFMPFILAYAVTAVLLAPILGKVSDRLRRRKFLSVLLIVLLLLLLVGLIGAVAYYLVTQVIGLVNNWDSTWNALIEAKDALAVFVADYSAMTVEEVNGLFDKGLGQFAAWLKNNLFNLEDIQSYLVTVKATAPAVGSFLLAFVFFVVAAYFTTAEYPRIRGMLSRCVPRFVRPQLRCIKEAAGSATFGYLRAQVIISGIVGLITFIALLIYGQSFALVIGLAVGVVDFFPVFGSSVITVPWAIVALLQGDWIKALFLMVMTFVLFMFRKLAEPKIVGDQTGLHPLLSLMSMYVGMKLAGILGMILMPILWMAVISLYRVGFFDPTIQDFYMLGRRIAEKTRLPKSDDTEEKSA